MSRLLILVALFISVFSPLTATAAVSPKIVAGSYHTVALMSDGTVKAWGQNGNGQLGNGTTVDSGSPVTVTGLGGPVTAIAAAGVNTVALLADGTVKAWGDGISTPATVTGFGGPVTAIAAGGSHYVALLADGTVKAWGYNDYGQLGNGTTSSGKLLVPMPVTGLGGPVTAIAAGGGHTVALLADGSVKAWGSNSYGQLGDGTFTNSSIPVTVSGPGGAVSAISAGYGHTAALMADGTVKAWGDNTFRQLGDGSQTKSSTPVTVIGLGGPVAAITAGRGHTVALMVDGTVKAWGWNTHGQLGDGTTVDSGSPVTVDGLGGPVTAIAAGFDYTVALLADGTVKAWGSNDYGQLGDGNYTSGSATPVTVTGLGGSVMAVSTGELYSMALMADGTVTTWGRNNDGQLGIGSYVNSDTPVAVTGLDGAATAIASGRYHTVALLADGTVKAWGVNADGQLGDGTTTGSSTPVTVIGLGGAATAIANGYYHTVALMADGTVKAWGSNESGRLGDSTTSDSSTPVTVTGLGGTVTAIAAGAGHTVALMADGTVKAWGSNYWGQLGDGTTTASSTPVTVTGLGGPVTAIAAGGSHTVALMADGTVKAWGWNYYGQIGDGTISRPALPGSGKSSPVTVTGLGGIVTAIAAGENHTVALLADGTVKAWGSNSSGQLGEGNMTDSSTPATVTGLGGTVTAISAGYNHTMALMADGTVKTWGDNINGQLGIIRVFPNPTTALINLDATAPATGNDLPAGGYIGSQTLHLDCSDNYSGCAGTWYTTDGSDPTYPPTGSTQLYDSSITINSTTTLKYFSRDLAGNSGPVRSRNYTIFYTPTYPLTVTITGSGTVSGTTTGAPDVLSYNTSGSAPVSPGVVVTLTAASGSGYGFSSWSGCDSSTGNQCTVTMDAARYVTVTFSKDVFSPKIAAGYEYTVALLAEGTLLAWGNNSVGQLGDGTTTNRSTPVPVTGLGGTVSAIAAGSSHTVALLADGTVKAWGSNYYGQLGNGTITNSSMPVTVAGLGGVVIAIAAGQNYTVALLADGTVKAWGSNYYGQLGNGTTTSSSMPVTVTWLGGPVIAIAAGQNYVVALLADGTVKAWGYNNYGQLGDSTTTNSSTPVTVTGLGGPVTAITCGFSHTVALMADGTLKSWGLNMVGQLGDGTFTNSSTPVTVIPFGGTVTAIVAGNHTMALLADGTVKSWGSNFYGQLGNGNTTNSNTPVTATGAGGPVTTLAVGAANTVALMADGTISAWGWNGYGQLGNGTTIDSVTPVKTSNNGGSNLQLTTIASVKVGSSYFGTINAGYVALGTGGSLLAQSIGFHESLVFSRSVSFTLQGGHGASFSTPAGISTIHGAITIAKGTVTFDGIVIQ